MPGLVNPVKHWVHQRLPGFYKREVKEKVPRISTFVYSEDSISHNTSQGQQMNIVNPQHVLRPMFVPSMFSFAVTFGIVDLDTKKEHKARYLLWGPEEGEPIVDSGEFNLPVPDEPSDLPMEASGYMMNMNFRNVPFKKEGFYTSEIVFDGQELGKFPVYVKGRGSA